MFHPDKISSAIGSYIKLGFFLGKYNSNSFVLKLVKSAKMNWLFIKSKEGLIADELTDGAKI